MQRNNLRRDSRRTRYHTSEGEKKGNAESVITYAFYDNGSGVSEKENRHTRPRPTKLQLGTMLGRSLVDSTIVEDLVVTDMTYFCILSWLQV